MIIPSAYTSDNLKVLGIAIRSKRLETGYSLRDLSEITNISHTLISNIEKGKQTPAPETLKDILNALDLEFHDDQEIITNMEKLRHQMIIHLMHHEYEDAKKILDILMKDEQIYLYSHQLINYVILKYLYYTMVGSKSQDIDHAIKHYLSLSEFFGVIQRQMMLFIHGLNHLNHERYNRAQEVFQEAVSLGNKEYDVFIKQYMVIAMVRQYKFMDAFNTADEVINEFENRAIYIRSMQTKLQVCRVYYTIRKYPEIERLLSQVERFAYKYNDKEIIEEVLLIRVAVLINKNQLERAKELLNQMPNQKAIAVALHRFKIAKIEGNPNEIKKVYHQVMKFPSVKDHYKIGKLITVQAMYKVPSLYDDKIYLEYLEFLCQRAVENNDQDIIGIAYNYLLDYYYSHRQYKKATEVAQDFLHHKKILQKL